MLAMNDNAKKKEENLGEKEVKTEAMCLAYPIQGVVK